MAGKFKLNTAGLATLTQIVSGLPSGTTYDHKALEATGTVTLANERDMAAVRKITGPGGVVATTET
jgi:hypothetical protein